MISASGFHSLHPLPFRALRHLSVPSCNCPSLCRMDPGQLCPQIQVLRHDSLMREEAMYHPFSHPWVCLSKKVFWALNLHLVCHTLTVSTASSLLDCSCSHLPSKTGLEVRAAF